MDKQANEKAAPEEQAQERPGVPKADGIRTLAEDVNKKIRAGEMTINDARKAVGLEPLPGPDGDRRYQRVIS